MQGQESLGLSCDLPQRILPRTLFASDHTFITLDTQRHANPLVMSRNSRWSLLSKRRARQAAVRRYRAWRVVLRLGATR